MGTGGALDALQGTGGAMRLFVGALWLQDTQMIGNTADTIAGAVFFNQSCFQVSMWLVALQLALSSRNTEECLDHQVAEPSRCKCMVTSVMRKGCAHCVSML